MRILVNWDHSLINEGVGNCCHRKTLNFIVSTILFIRV